MSVSKARPADARRVLITGATGFAGRHLIEFLLADARRNASGPRLNIIGTCYPERPEDCPKFRSAFPGVKLIPLDLRDAGAVSAAVSSTRPDRIFHLAAISQVKASWDKRKETIETNILGTFNLFEAVRHHAPKARILFVSSSDVYGKQGSECMPLKETSRTGAASPYGFTKLSGEALAGFYVRSEKLRIVIARPFTHTGPGQSPDFVCSDWARQVAVIESSGSGGRGGKKGALKVGNLSVKRDYSDVRDVVRAYALLIEKGKAGEAYNISSGKSPSLQVILGMLRAKSKARIFVKVDPGRFRKADIPLLSGSHAKITRETGWKPRFDLETTLSDLLEEWRIKVRSESLRPEASCPPVPPKVNRRTGPTHVLITGGAGYIGSMLVSELLRTGRRVTVVDSLVHGGNSLLPFLSHPAFAFHRADVCDRRAISPAFAGVDAVIHLAAIVGYPACDRAGREASFGCNVDGTRNVFEEAERAGAERFLFASSYSNYGLSPDGRPVTEESELFPQSVYAETKIEAEKYLVSRAAEPKTKTAPILFRFATLFGPSPRTRFDLIINQFVWEAVVDRKLAVYQPRFNRSFVHVRDVVGALTASLEAPLDRLRGQIFNIGSNNANYSKAEIADLIRKYAPPFDLSFPDLSFDGDMRDIRVAFDKVERVLGWKAGISVEEGIRELVGAISSGFLKK